MTSAFESYSITEVIRFYVMCMDSRLSFSSSTLQINPTPCAFSLPTINTLVESICKIRMIRIFLQKLAHLNSWIFYSEVSTTLKLNSSEVSMGLYKISLLPDKYSKNESRLAQIVKVLKNVYYPWYMQIFKLLLSVAHKSEYCSTFSILQVFLFFFWFWFSIYSKESLWTIVFVVQFRIKIYSQIESIIIILFYPMYLMETICMFYILNLNYYV